MSEVLCKPKVMAIKSPSLEKLEEMEKMAMDYEVRVSAGAGSAEINLCCCLSCAKFASTAAYPTRCGVACDAGGSGGCGEGQRAMTGCLEAVVRARGQRERGVLWQTSTAYVTTGKRTCTVA